VNFVFHGGSGSSADEIKEAISYGVVKMNIDTDLQWATWDGVRKYYKANEGYLQTQIGNPEGDDKPAKYPVIFRAADLVMITKADLLPVLDDFDPEYATRCVRELANPAPVLTLSARKGTALEDWLDWVRAEVRRVRKAAA